MTAGYIEAHLHASFLLRGRPDVTPDGDVVCIEVVLETRGTSASVFGMCLRARLKRTRKSTAFWGTPVDSMCFGDRWSST